MNQDKVAELPSEGVFFGYTANRTAYSPEEKMKQHIAFHFSKILIATCYCLLVVSPILASAADITLQWDANDPVPDGYRLYARQNGEVFDYTNPLWDGAVTTHQVQDLTPGITYFFVVRAYASDLESGDSNEVEYTPPDSGSTEDLDRDGDGVENSEDAFPDDASEWLDTDNDGIGNNTDTDDDGDGMPDSWETLYEGLNSLIDDAQSDLDGDGITNLDEYYAGSDPSIIQEQENSPPNQPELVTPANASVVGLTPTLSTGIFIDADGDSHDRTQYQIATESDFTDESLVYNHTSSTQLTSLTVIDLILDPETNYYWRVRFFDEHNSASEWSEVFFFTTVEYDEAGDIDGDGVPDDQQVDETIDMDQDGTADVTQDGIVSVSTPCSMNPWIAVKRNADDIHIAAMRSYSADELGTEDNRPEQMTGVVSFKLHLETDVTETMVTIYLYEPASDDARWYQYDSEDGWSVFPDASFSTDRKSVTITLEDGGIGDQDGVLNGIIVSPTGLGFLRASTETSLDDSVGTDAEGCFISSPMNELASDIVMPNLCEWLFASLGLAVLLIGCQYIQMKRQ